ncbi:hypothetical protein CLU79DRAFT_771599 [Phycomyces nitens]|nr:hypothetical protein CLU79DRAFT_771599 [Phycomyces nitens]
MRSSDTTISHQQTSTQVIELTPLPTHEPIDIDSVDILPIPGEEPPPRDEEENEATKALPFYLGGISDKHKKILTFVGRCGFIAKGVVYGIIGVLSCTNVTGAWTPNGSQNNESPQGAFLLLGGIPYVGRPILVILAIGLLTYIIWRFWEAITSQGADAKMSKPANFFRYRLSPFVSGCVYVAYTYYVIRMIYETPEEQQQMTSSKSFPGSWTDSALGKAGISILGIAFMIATITQIVNSATGNFRRDLCTSEPDSRQWEAAIVNTAGRIGFAGRAAVFGTLSGFFWDSIAKRNESGANNVIGAAMSKLATSSGGQFFLMLTGISLVIYGVFSISNAYYKYFPTPPPSRVPMYTPPKVRRVSPIRPSHQSTVISYHNRFKWWNGLAERIKKYTSSTIHSNVHVENVPTMGSLHSQSSFLPNQINTDYGS